MDKILLEPSPLQAKQSQLSLSFLILHVLLFLWPFSEFSPCISCMGKPRTGYNALDVVSPAAE